MNIPDLKPNHIIKGSILPEPIKTVVRVLLIVVLCLIVIAALLPLIPGHGLRLLH